MKGQWSLKDIKQTWEIYKVIQEDLPSYWKHNWNQEILEERPSIYEANQVELIKVKFFKNFEIIREFA